jgi:conjugative transfer region protein TrbK
MDGKTFASIGAIVFVVIAIVATAIEINRTDVSPDTLAPQGRPVSTRGPLDEELRRCSQIGEAGASDPACLKTWDENRRRFLGQRAPAASAVAPPAMIFPNEAAPSSRPVLGQPATSQPEVR